MFSYRVYDVEGNELKDATYTQMIEAGKRSGSQGLELCAFSTS